MPWTQRQEKMFHASAERGEPGMEKLAEEADAEAKAGTLRPPVHHDDEEEKHEPWQSLRGEE